MQWRFAMYKGLVHTHSSLRYILLALLITVLVQAGRGVFAGKSFTKSDDKLSLFLFIATHLQLTVGLILYFVSPRVHIADGYAFSTPDTRYYTVEHIAMNLIAVAFISVARISSKKQTTDIAKHKRLFWWTLAGVVLLIVSLSAPQGPGLVGSAMAGH